MESDDEANMDTSEIEYLVQSGDEFEEDDDDSVKDPDYLGDDAGAEDDDEMDEDADANDDEDDQAKHDDKQGEQGETGNDEQGKGDGEQDEAAESFTDLNFLKIVDSVGRCFFHKSQTPAMKKKKKDALLLVSAQWWCLRNQTILSDQQVKRKLDNLKTRVKIKVDRKKTGNRAINMTDADALLMQMLDGEINPSISPLPCK